MQGTLLATALTAASPFLIEQATLAPNRIATGNRGQLFAPADVFATRDGHIMILVVGEPMYARWTKLIGEEHWLEDERFQTDDSRGAHSDILSARMADWCAERTSAQAIAELEAARISVGPVYTPQQALDDPHVRDGGFFEEIDYPGAPGPVPLVTTPVRLRSTPGTIRSRPPRLGEHTAGILGELGYEPADIERFRKKRAI